MSVAVKDDVFMTLGVVLGAVTEPSSKSDMLRLFPALC